MLVHNNIQLLPLFKNAVITIGTFDGVHTGHRQIIELMKTEAAAVHGETVIITFHPHPRQVIGSGRSPIFLINALQEKILLLEKCGVDHIVVVPFTEVFANQSAEKYITDFLVHTFHPHTIIIGHDHHFGKNRSGNYALLEQKASEYNYLVKEIPEYMLADITISSTRIRKALQGDDIATANNFLGYNYFFSGTVVEGNKLGRTIGYPTANLHVDDENKLIPGNGVYAVEVVSGEWSMVNGESSIVNGESSMVKSESSIVKDENREDIKFKGMMNIGIRPTVDGTKRVIEVNIFDFDKEIYGEKITVTLKKHLRNEIKFSGLDELKKQLAKDKAEAKIYLNQLK